MKETATTRGLLILASVTVGATASILTVLNRYVHSEIRRRGYPSWDVCRCDFKSQQSIFQVWYSQNERRGETIVSQEWGTYLVDPPKWLRRFLHHSSQVIATLNPRQHYLERVTLSPQEAHQFAALLYGTSSDEEQSLENAQIVWRREILHEPRYSFGVCTRRLYPVHIPQERIAEVQPLPVLWDPQSDLPLATEGVLLETEVGTRIDLIGWTPSQISYCTVRRRAQ